MEYQEMIKLLGKTPNQPTKFRTKINEYARGKDSK